MGTKVETLNALVRWFFFLCNGCNVCQLSRLIFTIIIIYVFYLLRCWQETLISFICLSSFWGNQGFTINQHQMSEFSTSNEPKSNVWMSQDTGETNIIKCSPLTTKDRWKLMNSLSTGGNNLCFNNSLRNETISTQQ